MIASKHNIISKLKNSEEFFIINALYGSADIIDENIKSQIEAVDITNSELIEKGYLVNELEEKSFFKKEYLKFLEDRDTDEIQIFFSTNYSCNFDCSYCYQSAYLNEKQTLTKEVIDSFFNYIDIKFVNRKKYITIFGGEPLLSSPNHKLQIEYLIVEANKRNLEIAIVTNGYTINDYLPIFINSKIREIQVTLDGTEEIHNKRRFLKNKNGTFKEIVEGIDNLIKNKINVNLRMVIDKENINNLPDLANFTIYKGWTDSPFFKTQLGRNYELHECQTNNSRLFTRIELYEEIYKLLKSHPEILKFHKPAFSISKFLYENGELPSPLFDSCPGTKTEWAFDFTGKIYSCTATVGKEEESLGTFFPNITTIDNSIFEWENRDIISVDKCKSCNLSLLCGGGCASVAKNKNGNLNSPDCRPIKELLELGISYYNNY